MSLFFEVPGQPVGKARPRFTRTGHAYTPKKTTDYEAAVRKAFRIAYPNHEPFTGAVSIEVYAFFAIPPSWPKWKREKAAEGQVPHLSKPDGSNVLKGVEDAIGPRRHGRKVIPGLAYGDDSQITDAGIQKRYATRPRVEVNITEGKE